MNGKTTKYRKYEGSGSGRINIPIALAESLSRKNGDEIEILSHTYKGIEGLFLYKKDIIKVKGGEINRIILKINEELYAQFLYAKGYTEWDYDHLFKIIESKAYRKGEKIVLDKFYDLAFEFFLKHNFLDIIENDETSGLPTKFKINFDFVKYYEDNFL